MKEKPFLVVKITLPFTLRVKGIEPTSVRNSVFLGGFTKNTMRDHLENSKNTPCSGMKGPKGTLQSSHTPGNRGNQGRVRESKNVLK